MAGVWAIDGVEVPASVARMLAYVAGGGAEGIVEPGGLKVLPLAVPGTSVRVMPGAGMVMNRYPGGGQQSYPIYEQVQQTVPIVATGSGGGRTDLIIARVRDPEFAAGAAGVTFEVIQGVPANAGGSYVQALAYPALALARVTLPASTATVQAAHITDLRSLSRPRSTRVRRMGAPSLGSLTSSSGTIFPNWATQVEIPSWATHMSVVADVLSLQIQGGAAIGRFAVVAGPAGASQFRSADTIYDVEVISVSEHVSMAVGGDDVINPSLRGSVQSFRTEASRLAGDGYLSARAGTHIVMDIQFEERVI